MALLRHMAYYRGTSCGLRRIVTSRHHALPQGTMLYLNRTPSINQSPESDLEKNPGSSD
jgi:hypothetical protein